MHYRVYMMDRFGHIARAQDMECADDQQALEQARAQARAHGTEVWQGARLVARLGANGESAP